MNIPTPEELDYYERDRVDEIVGQIVAKMRQKIFTFEPEPEWRPFLVRLMVKFSGAWTLSEVGDGTREGGKLWRLSPKTKARYDE